MSEQPRGNNCETQRPRSHAALGKKYAKQQGSWEVRPGGLVSLKVRHKARVVATKAF